MGLPRNLGVPGQVPSAMLDRWRTVMGIKAHFEKIICCSVHEWLPGAAEKSLR